MFGFQRGAPVIIISYIAVAMVLCLEPTHMGCVLMSSGASGNTWAVFKFTHAGIGGGGPGVVFLAVPARDISEVEEPPTLSPSEPEY